MKGEKAIQRAELRKRLAETTAEIRESAGRAAMRHLAGLPAFVQSRSVALFLSTGAEIATAPLFRRALGAGKRIAVPAWRRSLRAYDFAWLDEGAVLHAGPHGILEPAHPVWLRAGETVDVIVAPCLGFDEQGGRLGHGGGYYDRLMERRPGLRVLFAMECQRLDRMEQESHDQRVEEIVTERGIRRAQRRKE